MRINDYLIVEDKDIIFHSNDGKNPTTQHDKPEDPRVNVWVLTLVIPMCFSNT